MTPAALVRLYCGGSTQAGSRDRKLPQKSRQKVMVAKTRMFIKKKLDSVYVWK